MRSPPARRLSGALLLLSALLSWGARPAAAEKVKEDVANNYVLSIPDSWRWIDGGADWAKYGIRARGVRELEAFKRTGVGKPEGQGGEVVVSILDAPAGKSLDEIAKDPQTVQFLMGRFGEDSTKWPAVESEKTTVPAEDGGEVPGILLSATGEARNLKAALNKKSRGALVLLVVRKKLFRVRMYAWPSEWDDEGLKDEITEIELSLKVLVSKEEKEPTPKPPASDEPPGPDDPSLQGDDGKEVPYGNDVQHWKIVKPAGIKVKEIDKDAQPNQMLYFEDVAKDGSASYQVFLNVFSLVTVDAAGGRHEGDMRQRIAGDWWKQFVASHPEGGVSTLDWVKKTKNRTFITIPDDSEPLKTLVKSGEKRPPEMDYAALEDKRVIERIKNAKLGKGDLADAYRGMLVGNRARTGRDIVMRFFFKTTTHAYEMTVTLTGDVLKAHGEKLQKLLESFVITEK